MKAIHVLCVVTVATVFSPPATGSLIELEAVTHLGMRWFCNPCDPIPLNGMSIRWGDAEHNRGFEDRSFLVYDLSVIEDPSVIQSATLSIGIQNRDNGGSSGIIDVATAWLPDPELPPEAFWWGDFLLDFEANENLTVYEVDVTQWIRDGAGDPEAPFAFFNLSTDTFDRFFVGPAVGFPVPTLIVSIPEPSSAYLLLVAAALLLAKGNRAR